MKELLIGLAVIGLFVFAYFVVDRLGGFLEEVAAQNAEEAPAEEPPQDAERAEMIPNSDTKSDEFLL